MKFTINEAQANVMGEFAMCMLNAVTAGHIHHLTTDSFSQAISMMALMIWLTASSRLTKASTRK
jgi:hypothetical protein